MVSLRYLPLMLVGLLVPPARGESVYDGLPAGDVQIVEDHQGTIHVAVAGAEGIILRAAGGTISKWKQGVFDGLTITPEGEVWLIENGRIQRAGSGPDAGGDADRTDSFRPVDLPGPLFASRWGDLWSAGSQMLRRGDGMFIPVPATGQPGLKLQPACDDPFGNVWARATDDQGELIGVAVLSQSAPYQWRLLELSDWQSSAPWLGPIVDDVGFVWLASAQSVVRLDPRAAGGDLRVIENPSSQPITAMARVANRQIILGFAEGVIRELTLASGSEPQWEPVVDLPVGPVRALIHDSRGDLWAASGSRLFRSEALREEWQSHWREVSRLPAGNHDIIFARINDRFYTAGGKTYFGWPASEWVNLDRVWSYDMRARIWRVEPPMLQPGKAYSGIAALGDELWLIGGYFRDGESTRATGTVEIYDPQRRRYRQGPAIDPPRGQVVALTIGNRLYAVGGGNEQSASDQMVSIAAGETSWRREPAAPAAIVQASGCVIDGKIYIAAGSRSSCPGLFVYDPRERIWSRVRHPAESAPNAPLCAAYRGEVWVMGGWDESGGRVASYAYAPASETWRRAPNLPLPVSWGAATQIGDELLIAGGAYREDRVGNYFNSDRVFILRKP